MALPQRPGCLLYTSACDLTLIQKLIDLSGLMGNALRVEKIIHSLNDRHGEADLARPIRDVYKRQMLPTAIDSQFCGNPEAIGGRTVGT